MEATRRGPEIHCCAWLVVIVSSVGFWVLLAWLFLMVGPVAAEGCDAREWRTSEDVRSCDERPSRDIVRLRRQQQIQGPWEHGDCAYDLRPLDENSSEQRWHGWWGALEGGPLRFGKVRKRGVYVYIAAGRTLAYPGVIEYEVVRPTGVRMELAGNRYRPREAGTTTVTWRLYPGEQAEGNPVRSGSYSFLAIRFCSQDPHVFGSGFEGGFDGWSRVKR